jgi:hypothetical protein
MWGKHKTGGWYESTALEIVVPTAILEQNFLGTSRTAHRRSRGGGKSENPDAVAGFSRGVKVLPLDFSTERLFPPRWWVTEPGILDSAAVRRHSYIRRCVRKATPRKHLLRSGETSGADARRTNIGSRVVHNEATVTDNIFVHRGNTLVRRLRLACGETMLLASRSHASDRCSPEQ